MKTISDMAKKTLIVGNSRCAGLIAQGLAGHDMPVIISVDKDQENPQLAELDDKEPIEILRNTQVTACRGHAGNFLVHMKSPQGPVKRNVNAVVIARENMRQPVFNTSEANTGFDIRLIRSESVMALSEIRMRINSEAGLFQDKTIVFLNSLHVENLPDIAEEIMMTAIRLRLEMQAKVYILTGNLKVAGNGLEALYRKAREAGVLFIKFTDTLPKIEHHPEKGVSIQFSDEITGGTFRISPPITIADEIITPSTDFNDLARVFGLHQDENGFLQAGNVHREGVWSNRKGVFIAGPSRSPANAPLDETDAQQAVLSVLSLSAGAMPVCEHPAEIRPGCIRCLTCFRSCPYQAIQIDTVLSVMPEACEGCGICTAECPRGVIEIDNLTISEIGRKITDITAAKESPQIIAFLCARSADAACNQARELGHSMPGNVKIIRIPCAGSLSVMHMLTAFSKGADGVLVLTCHEGNCHAEKGNLYAMNRAEQVKEMLSGMGIEEERLRVKTLASNMGKEFADIVNDFANHIREKGK